MLDEGFEGDSPEESEKKPRTYVSNAPQTDPEKLARELERVKKNLEKEQFFNRLLDQELKELKNNPAGAEPVYPTFAEKKGLSGGAILIIFILVVGVGGYFGYKWLNRQPVNNFSLDVPAPAIGDTTTEAQQKLNSVPSGSSSSNSDPLIDSNDIIAKKSTTPPVDETIIKDDPPVGNEKKDPPKREEKKKPAPIVQDNTEEDLPLEDDPVTKPSKPVTQQQTTVPPANNNQPATNNNQPAVKPPATTGTASTTSPTGLINVNNIMTPPLTNRRVLGLYTNVSKANFYRAPDESTMMTSFLFQGTPVQVGALAEQNGFIYVEYTNAVGYTIKGWLSKKDLKKLN